MFVSTTRMKLNLHYYSIRFLKIVFILLCIPFSLLAQETVVVGQVINTADNTPLPFVNIYFKNTTKGVQSNEEGYFMIKSLEDYQTLIFSAVGFKKEQLRIKAGQSIGVQIYMKEDNTLLEELFVIPGANKALELMKKVRIMRDKNDYTKNPTYAAESKVEQLVLLDKVNQSFAGKRIFNQLKNGSLSSSDSALVIPLYMAESKYQITANKKTEVSKNIFSSNKSFESILQKLLDNQVMDLNFYENSVTLLGKSMISPLASVGFAYYKYYLADSAITASGKQYEIHYRTKDTKNLAFFGKMNIDSATFALTSIEAELPQQANINYIKNLKITQKFKAQNDKIWAKDSENLVLTVKYDLFIDSISQQPRMYVKRSSTYNYYSSIFALPEKFAESSYSTETVDTKLKELNNTPVLRTAKWMADAIFTGYMRVGKIDIGKVQEIIRVTDIEGFRLNIPFRTNEHVWKNLSLGGHLGYGFKNQIPKYSTFAQYKLPSKKRRLFELSYTNDYRRADYNYNNYLFLENPLLTGDADITSTIFTLKSSRKMNERIEYSLSYSNEWTNNLESFIYLRSNKMLSNSSLPLQKGNINYTILTQQSVTFVNRFSFNEGKYDDHTQRIYIRNSLPVLYSIFEYGQFNLGKNWRNYGKISLSLKHIFPLYFGQFKYVVDAGIILGDVPYPLLQTPASSEASGYSTYRFTMNYKDYVADKFVNFQTQLTTNGLLLNKIPLIKNWNLREIVTFNLAYGGLNNSNQSTLDFPILTYPIKKPYMEVGVGITNILRVLTVQSIWRLTDRDDPLARLWRLRVNVTISL